MIVPYKNGTAVLPEGLNARWTKKGDVAEIIFSAEQKEKYTRARIPIKLALQDIGKWAELEALAEGTHPVGDAIKQMIGEEDYTKMKRYLSEWIVSGNDMFRWDNKTLLLSQALQLDMDDIFTRAEAYQ